MKLLIFIVLTGIANVLGDGKFTVLTHPDHVKFVATSKQIDTLEIPFVITNLFGLPSSVELKWNGLLEGNPFLRPKALAFFSIFHKDSNGMVLENAQKSYQTQKKTWGLDEEHVSTMIQQVTWDKEPLIIETSLQNQILDIKSTHEGESSSLSLDSVLEEIRSSGWIEKHNVKNLNVSSDVDLVLLGELYGITKTINSLQEHPEVTKNPSPDFFHFKVIGLRSLEGDEKVSEAWRVLEEVITEATEVLKGLYHNNVVVAALSLSSEPSFSADLGRHLQALVADNAKRYRYAPKFTDIYPAMFNIILWVSIGFFLVIGGVAWGMWHMDPGRDSVIYRMTTQRLKRD